MPECDKCPIQKEYEALKEWDSKTRALTNQEPRKIECYLALAVGKAMFG